jgi:voltage-gated potassium channel
MENPNESVKSQSADEAGERLALLEQLQDLLEWPMLVLALAWLLLFILEMTLGLNPLFQSLGYVVWGLFVLDFVIRLALAPRKLVFVRGNWLSAASLLLPALRVARVLRVLRIARLSRVARSARLLRALSSTNRGMRALRSSMRRRGFGYVVALTFLVLMTGAAGMYAFEADQTGSAIDSYANALWWTAMLMTTMGSDYWPQSPEGRLLCFMLSLFAFGVFGYVTATLASFFVGRDAAEARGEVLSADVEALRIELARLRAELHAINDRKPA